MTDYHKLEEIKDVFENETAISARLKLESFKRLKDSIDKMISDEQERQRHEGFAKLERLETLIRDRSVVGPRFDPFTAKEALKLIEPTNKGTREEFRDWHICLTEALQRCLRRELIN